MTDINQKNKVILKQENIYNLSDGSHPLFCSCNACGNSRDTNFSDEEISNSSSKRTGTFQELGNFIRTSWDIDRKFNLTKSGLNSNNGKLLYDLSSSLSNYGYSELGNNDFNGITSSRKALARNSFQILESTLGIDFEEKTDSTSSDLI